MSKTIREHIAKIQVERSNLQHIASTGQINGSLLLSIEKIMQDYSQSQTQELTEWKESASKVFKNLDLQAIGKTLGIGLGEDVSTNVLPKVKGLIEQNKELVEMLSLFCMDMEERGRAYGDAYTMSKELLTKYNHLK